MSLKRCLEISYEQFCMKAYTPEEEAELIATFLRLEAERETPEQKEAKAKALQEFRELS